MPKRIKNLKNPLANRAKPTTSKRTYSWIFLVGSLFAIPAISGDMYLPALPDLVEEFGTTQTAAQLTISMTMVGGAFGQLLVGPLLDKFGRRRPVLTGLTLHVAMSILCALAPSIELLMVFRFIQGAANASANVTGMAVSRDKFKGAKGVRMMSRFMLVVGVAPLFAPTIGTFMIHLGGWRAVFWLLALIGGALLAFCYFHLPQTMDEKHRKTVRVTKLIRLYGTVIRDRQFLCLAAVGGLTQSVMMSWVVSAPFVTQVEWGFSATWFAICFAVNGLALVVGAQVNAAIASKFDPRQLFRASVLIQFTFVSALFLTTFFGVVQGPPILIFVICATFFHTFVTSSAFTIAMEKQDAQAGTASAVIGISNSLLPSIIAPLTGAFGGNVKAMAAVMLGTLITTLLVSLLGTDIFRKK